MIWLYAALGVAALAAALFLTARFASIGFLYQPPRPLQAPPRRTPDCSVPGDQATLSAIDGSTTGGVYRAQQVVIPQGTTITLTSTLIIVADELLQVDGTITVSANPAPRNVPVDIVLVSLGGDVKINGEVGVPMFGLVQAPAGADSNVQGHWASASGGVAEHAGYIKIVAQQGSIDILGSVAAVSGGEGGSATATGVAGPWNAFGGTAGAAGAQGGAGGDVRLCALDAIHVGQGARVVAGQGGGGGIARATAVNGSPAYAEGAPSNNGGDVWIDGLDPTCQVFNEGSIFGGPVQFGNAAWANGGNAAGWGDRGGNASAAGGEGGHGGTVRFTDCKVGTVGTINAWMGGGGGDATAVGGNGGAGAAWGLPGGDATARGGDGGPAGPIPQIPLLSGGTAQGGLINPPGPAAGFVYGKGGDASATAGSGGPGRNFGGGPSGSEDALGGTGSVTNTPATPATAGPVAGVGGAGGVAAGSMSPGTR